MINKDYILRMAERFGRYLAIILRLREYNKQEEALLYIDELFLQTTGLTTGFINSASEEMLLNLISPLGVLNVEKCLWMAVLLQQEGDIYVELGKSNESYYRYLKALHLFLEVASHNSDVKDIDITMAIDDILNKLAEYELPLKTNNKIFRYFEKMGSYARAEDVLFEMVEAGEEEKEFARSEIVEQGISFYNRLLKKSDADLKAGNLSREEVKEGLAQLVSMRNEVHSVRRTHRQD
jgi:tetratricopeptide (TPR) repeat protein